MATSHSHPHESSTSPRLWAAVVAIFVLAGALRFWRIAWGLDSGLAFADEVLVWGRYVFAFMPLGWESFVGNPLPYPPLYGYLAGLSVAAAHAIELLGPDRNLFHAIFVARAVSAVASIATVGVVLRLGSTAYGRCSGLLGAALIASVPQAVLQVHYASVDELLALATATTLLAACVFTARRTPLLAFTCGLCVGASAATKYNGILIAAAPGWVLLEVAVTDRSCKRFILLGTSFCLGVAIALLVACPPCWLETERVRRSLGILQYLSTSTLWRPPNNHLSLDVGWYGRKYAYQIFAGLPFAMGVPAYLVSLLGVAIAASRRTPADRVMLVGLASWFLFVGNMEVTFQRYLQPLLPGLAALGARGVIALRLRASVTAVIAAVVVGYSGILGASQISRLSYDHQLGIAQWIAERYPEQHRAQLRVAVPQESADWFQLQLPLSRIGVSLTKVAPGRWLAAHPDVFLLPEWYATSVRRDPARAAFRNELQRLEAGQAGYREEARFDTYYFNEGFYTWLDPAFASDLWMGAIGFRLYVPDTSEPPLP